MRRRFGIPVLALTTVIALAASCGGSSSEPVFTEAKRTIQVAAGERFRIELDANPGVGDDWSVASQPAAAVAQLVDEGFESSAPEGVTGAPGVEYFVFEAVAPGASRIVFRYCYRGCGGEGRELERTASFELIVGD
jgi:predicted secreted protein